MRSDKGWLWGAGIVTAALALCTLIGTCYNTRTTKKSIDTAATEVLDGIQASQGNLTSAIACQGDRIVDSLHSVEGRLHKQYRALSGQLATHDEDAFDQYTVLSGKQDNLAGQVGALDASTRFEFGVVESLVATPRHLVGRGVFSGVYRGRDGKPIGKTDGKIGEIRFEPEDTTSGVRIEYGR